jgi:hypothetical protein
MTAVAAGPIGDAPPDCRTRSVTLMHPFEGLAGLLEWAGPDLAHNLDFIPEDKLSWKAGPQTKSALEAAAEAAYFMRSMIQVLGGGTWEVAVPEPVTKEQVQQVLREDTPKYAAALRALPVEKMGEVMETPFGSFPLGRLATFPVADVIHHRGQVCFLQTMLGDIENHFLME